MLDEGWKGDGRTGDEVRIESKCADTGPSDQLRGTLVVVRSQWLFLGELFRKWDRAIGQGSETWPTNKSFNGKRA